MMILLYINVKILNIHHISLFSRFMNSPKGKYSGVLNCARQTAQREGVKAFYSGFRASCMRLVSWNIVLWLSYEQLKLASQNYNNKSK